LKSILFILSILLKCSGCLNACYAKQQLYSGALQCYMMACCLPPYQAHRRCCSSCSQVCSYAMRMLQHSQDALANPAAALLRYLLSSRMADAKSPAATWSAAREHFCSQRCVGVTPGVGATNWLSSPGAVLASATTSGGRSRSCMGTHTHSSTCH
jgi:hypothetical protein